MDVAGVRNGNVLYESVGWKEREQDKSQDVKWGEMHAGVVIQG